MIRQLKTTSTSWRFHTIHECVKSSYLILWDAYNYIKYFSGQLWYSVVAIEKLNLFDMMYIALIKYKRMRKLSFERLEIEASWKNFLMGTHPSAGENSVLLKIRGNSAVIEQIQKFVYGVINERIAKHEQEVEKLLCDVNARNKYIIPGIVDDESIPERKFVQYATMSEEERGLFTSSMHAAMIGYDSSDAWMKATQDDDILQNFMKCGKVTSTESVDRKKLITYFGTLGLELSLNLDEILKINLYRKQESLKKKKTGLFKILKKKWASIFKSE